MGLLTSCLLCGLYIQGGLSYHEHVPSATKHDGYESYWTYDANKVANPAGVLAIGDTFYESRRIKWDIELRHESFIPAHDIGVNSIQLSVTWHPFR